MVSNYKEVDFEWISSKKIICKGMSCSTMGQIVLGGSRVSFLGGI